MVLVLSFEFLLVYVHRFLMLCSKGGYTLFVLLVVSGVYLFECFGLRMY